MEEEKDIRLPADDTKAEEQQEETVVNNEDEYDKVVGKLDELLEPKKEDPGVSREEYDNLKHRYDSLLEKTKKLILSGDIKPTQAEQQERQVAPKRKTTHVYNPENALNDVIMKGAINPAEELAKSYKNRRF